MFNLDDLPDFLLVEILCRLPQKSAVQCKCVSKRWLSLVSDPYFVGRFLCLQSDNKKPIPLTTMIFTNPTDVRKFFSMSELPFSHRRRNFSLSFLPCYRTLVKEQVDDEPIVIGAYNDLVLCCKTISLQRDYYICNPYTKQWYALPPAPQCHEEVRVGFICEPYYKECNKEYVDWKERSSTRTMFQLNVDYRYRVMRIIPKIPESSFQFKAEIFSSETGKWTESVVLSRRSFCFSELVRNAGVVYNEMLYWWSDSNGFIIGVDPYANNITASTESSGSTGDHNLDRKYYCRFIDKPENEVEVFCFLGVCSNKGCLRMVLKQERIANDNNALSFWDFKDDRVDNTGKWSLVGRVPMLPALLQNPSIAEWMLGNRHSSMTSKGLAFDSNNDDIFYLQWYEFTVMLNIRETMITEIWRNPDDYHRIYNGRDVFPLVLPWWPTPILRHKLEHKHSGLSVETISDTAKAPKAQKVRGHQENVANKEGNASTKKLSARPAANLKAGAELDKKQSYDFLNRKKVQFSLGKVAASRLQRNVWFEDD